ncbi:MAG: cell wall hydrolase [Lachnospira sp.]|nr:cell wall hydrolase [Lachnospira sp.]
MRLRSRKSALYIGLALVMLCMPIIPDVVVAQPTYEQQSGQIEKEQKEASYTENVVDIVATGYNSNQEKDIYADMAISIAEGYVSVYEQADENADVAGRLYVNSIMSVLETNGEWAKISSKNLTGYVRTSALCMNDEAKALADGKDVTVTVTSNTTSVYSSAMGDSVLCRADKDASYIAVGKCGGYVVVKYNGDIKGYIPAANLSFDYGFAWGYTEAEAAEKEAAEAAAEAARKAKEEAARKAAAEAARIAANKITNPITYNEPMTVSETEVYLLACLIDYEAGWEPYEGKLAVANVVLNRVRSPYYGSTITKVIYAQGQFTGVSDGKGGPSVKFQTQYLDKGPRTDECMKAAREALAGKNNIGTFKNFRSLKKAKYASYSKYQVIKNHCFF